jgi:hypothetical protein
MKTQIKAFIAKRMKTVPNDDCLVCLFADVDSIIAWVVFHNCAMRLYDQVPQCPFDSGLAALVKTILRLNPGMITAMSIMEDDDYSRIGFYHHALNELLDITIQWISDLELQ